MHFASAFALMARTLNMPSRIVVGYLPGTANGESSTSSRSSRCRASCFTHGQRCTSRTSAGCRSSPPPASACRRRSRRPRRSPGGPTPGRDARRDSAADQHRRARSERPQQPARRSGIGSDDRHRQPAARAQHRARHPASARAPRPRPRRAQPSARRGGPRRRRRIGLDDRAGCRDRPRHPGSGERDARAPSPIASSTSTASPPDAMDALLLAIERASYAPTRSRDFLASEECDGCRARGARLAHEQRAAVAPHPRPPCASLADRAPRQRLRRPALRRRPAVSIGSRSGPVPLQGRMVCGPPGPQEDSPSGLWRTLGKRVG